MKRFAFPLDRVLALRRQQVQIEQMKLERILTEFRRIEREIEEVRERARTAEEEVLNKRVLETVELESLYAFRLWSSKQSALLAEQLGEWDKRAVDQRISISEARQGHRLVEKLRERRLSEWEAGFEKELEEQAAESFLARWNRERSLAIRHEPIASPCPHPTDWE